MACQFMQWLIAGAGPTAFQHALVGAGCLLAFDMMRRWRGKGVVAGHTKDERREESPSQRRAA